MLHTLKNWFYFCAGIAFLKLAKVKNILQGYSTPKPFSIHETTRCIEYDIDVVDHWLSHLQEYTSTGHDDIIHNKRVLELGPGSDLGAGLYLLSKGAAEYNAVDVNNLVKSVPDVFYDDLFVYLKDKNPEIQESFLQEQLERLKSGDNDKLNYVCRDDFDIASALKEHKIDIVFSQAAFEHFDDIEETIVSLDKVVTKGGVAIILVDLQTHSRWIREKDPINIYRYPTWIYRLFKFRGTPNRVRPYQYKNAFEKHGWGNIIVKPGTLLPDDNYNFAKDHLSKEFRSENNQMNYLSMWLYATKL